MCFTREGFALRDVAIEGERITLVEESIETLEGDEVIDLEGCHLTPGLVDVHVHLREPGFEYKETIQSGTAAAAHGGYTTIFTMPNLKPVPDSVENLKVQSDAIERDALIEVLPYASITHGQSGKGELVDFEALAPHVAGFSDDGRGVQSAELMAQAMERAKAVNRPIVAHCEVDDLLHGGYIHDGEYCAANNHRGICSQSEWEQVKRDLEMVEDIQCQYHICHISARESVEYLRAAKAKGLKVSGETGPHYLLLSDADLEENGRFKMNPPIRSHEDQMELVNAILDGTIEVIATDHAPHSHEEKSRGLEKSAFGIVGLESAFSLMYTYFVRRGVLPLEKLVELMSVNPRRLFGLEGGYVEVGTRADLAAFDLNREFTVDTESFLSKGHATPFEGWRVCGATRLVIFRGESVYSE